MDYFNPDFVEHIRDVDDERIRFKLRSRTYGYEEYNCIFCGWINKFRMGPDNWMNRCGYEGCRRSMGFGRIGYILPPRGPLHLPPDLVIPGNLRESHPEGDLGRWKSGQTIHEVRLILPQ